MFPFPNNIISEPVTTVPQLLLEVGAVNVTGIALPYYENEPIALAKAYLKWEARESASGEADQGAGGNCPLLLLQMKRCG